VLSAWRRQAQPFDPIEKQVHQAILRTFARRGHPPAPSDLDQITAATSRSTDEVLAALHELDAIGLSSEGQITVAYPFSAEPTRHLVRIGHESAGTGPGADAVEVYSMCAIDALGIAAMLDSDVRIESVDVTSGRPITVTMPAPSAGDDSRWEPTEAVVFVGADAAGGPSADCCCNYLTFFTSLPAARAWTATHPHIPGQILSQAAAEELGTRLFVSLLES
jgi:hypothetical protein